MWSHPLLLPCLFLVAHAQRTRSYVYDNLSQKVVHIEESVGVTKAGRSQKAFYPNTPGGISSESRELFVNGQLQREHAKTLMQSINDLSTWLIFTKRSPQWDIDCAKFLLRLINSSTRLMSYRNIAARTFHETLDYVQNYCEACLETTQSSEERMKLQLNIVTMQPDFVSQFN